eukprot:CAMPEP_0116921230 /NCGR_PEP_ID=MMETSP0467-20121206/21502_1 /TAXON_ID=283647 /ORGANISM="Mesodinium pulex, Strain SPMC105" /LENGTH=45 /DNA_ID= /DNA_START= /DNA_END= /DNA_ORIENTATION=
MKSRPGVCRPDGQVLMAAAALRGAAGRRCVLASPLGRADARAGGG